MLAEQEWDRLADSLRSMASLQDDWDGLAASAPSKKLVATTFELAELLCREGFDIPSSAVATPMGSILFAWQHGDRHMEVEVVEPDLVEWMVVGSDGKPRHGVNLRSEGKPLGAFLAASLDVARRYFKAESEEQR